MASYKDHLQVIKGFCDKADGKDKLTALIQYACMFISAGEPGQIKKIQASVTAARKVFRVMRPLESLHPVLIKPGFSDPLPVDVMNKLKALFMAVYFGADHFVWAYQIGLTTNKQLGEKAQKISLWSWALGSVCTILTETYALALNAAQSQKLGPDDDDKRKELAKTAHQKQLVLAHGLVQALLAVGLLQVLPFKPRTVGLLGVIASAMNCYFLLPAYPAPPKQKTV